MYRTIAIVALLLIVTGLSGYVFYLHDSVRQYRRIADHQTKIATIWENEAGQSRARIESLQTSLSRQQEFNPQWIDSLSQAMEVDSKHWQSALSVGTNQSRTIRIPVVVRETDTVYRYRDNWMDMSTKLNDDFLTIQFDELRDSLGFVSHLHRNGLFGRRKLTLDAISFNPHTKFTSVRHWSRSIPPQRWGLTVFGGYDLFNQQWVAGVGIGYQVIPFGGRRRSK